MGHKYEVWVWEDHSGEGDYGWAQRWAGEGAIRMALEVRAAKKAGFGCVKVEIR